MKGQKLVLAISGSPRGFAFVIFQGPTTPIDWGVKVIPGSDKNALCLIAIKKLIRRYQPTAIVLEEAGRDSRRGPRVRALYRRIVELAGRERVTVARYTKEKVRATFAAENATTRPEIAKVIAGRIPAFAPKLPPPRKIWMSEDPRQSLFDAAALGMTGYAGEGKV